MKKLFVITLVITLFSGCKKEYSPAPPVPANKIAGKWNIAFVTTLARDAAGTAKPSGVVVYPGIAGMYYQFNDDNTWVVAAEGVYQASEPGSYVLTADSALTLTSNTPPVQKKECRITTLSAGRLVFSFQKPVLFDGVTPGFIEYIFELKR